MVTTITVFKEQNRSKEIDRVAGCHSQESNNQKKNINITTPTPKDYRYAKALAALDFRLELMIRNSSK